MRPGIIAIDGPAASGKSSTARAAAEAIGFSHLDSGSLYRAVTRVALTEARALGLSDALLVPPEVMLRAAEDRGLMLQPDGAGFSSYLDGEPADQIIRSPEVTANVSAISAIPVVREWVNSRLRELARAGIGVVVDGRDIGTVVFPEADVKVFLTASPAARAERRLLQRGNATSREELEQETARLAARDLADSTRDLAPLRRADDAHEVDTTALNFDEQVAYIVQLARNALG